MPKKFFIFSTIIFLIVFGFLIYNLRESEKVEAGDGTNFLKIISGNGGEYGKSVIQTSDGGYVVTGYTSSWGAGNSDVFLSKFDSGGNLSWTKTVGGSNYDRGLSIVQTTDGGYVITGYTNSWGVGSEDILLLKLDSTGNLSWTKTVGGDSADRSYSIAKTTDGGYIVAGYTTSWGPANNNILFLKFDLNNNLQWTRVIGKGGFDEAYSVIQTSDGGYVVTGRTSSWGAGSDDILLLKLDSTGNLSWTKAIGGTGVDLGYSVIQTSDGGYVVTGSTTSWGAGGIDVLVLKLDSAGNLSWAKAIGSADFDRGFSAAQTVDGGYTIAGHYEIKTSLFKMDSNGNFLWAKTFGNYSADSGDKTADGGYILTGYTNRVNGTYDVLLIKTDNNGNISACPSVVSVFPAFATPTPTVSGPPPPPPSIDSPSPTVVSPSPTITSPSPTIITECLAGAVNNVSLWAWSENIGWISFNCSNQGTCGTVNYGVNIDPATGNFSGYAWSEHIGWIKFNPVGPYPSCPPTTCPTSPTYSARLDFNTRKVTGWARTCAGAADVANCSGGTNPNSGGWDGWILMGPIVKNATDYGVWIDFSVNPAQFKNWAWGFDVVGWISFNDSNTGAAVDYQVVTTLTLPNQPPTVSNAQLDGESYCTFTGDANGIQKGRVGFKWTYKDWEGDDQAYYWLEVATDLGFNILVINCKVPNYQAADPNVDKTMTSGVEIVSTLSNVCNDGELIGNRTLRVSYDNTYHWRVRSKAETGNTNWSDLPAVGPSFTARAHAHPWVDFTWSPQSPSVNEVVPFTDVSGCYDADGLCNSWSWIFQDGEPSASTIQDPQTKFTSSGSKNITLTVTDSDNFSCTGSKSLNITFPIPQWKEILPTF